MFPQKFCCFKFPFFSSESIEKNFSHMVPLFIFFRRCLLFRIFQLFYEFVRQLVQYLLKIHTFWCHLEYTLSFVFAKFVHTSLFRDYIWPPWRAFSTNTSQTLYFYEFVVKMFKFWRILKNVSQSRSVKAFSSDVTQLQFFYKVVIRKLCDVTTLIRMSGSHSSMMWQSARHCRWHHQNAFSVTLTFIPQNVCSNCGFLSFYKSKRKYTW